MKTKFTAPPPPISLLLRSDPSFRSNRLDSNEISISNVRGVTKFFPDSNPTLSGTQQAFTTSLERLYFSPTSLLLSLPRAFDLSFFHAISFSLVKSLLYRHGAHLSILAEPISFTAAETSCLANFRDEFSNASDIAPPSLFLHFFKKILFDSDAVKGGGRGAMIDFRWTYISKYRYVDILNLGVHI